MKIIGVLLAGGRSSRMKQDKALLDIAGQTLLSRQFELLESVVGRCNVVVSGDRPEYPSIRDELPELGPIEGVRSVMNRLTLIYDQPRLLVIPVDMPVLDASYLVRLLRSGVKCDVVKYSQFEMPFYVKNFSKVLKLLGQLCLQNQNPHLRSFRELMRRIDIHELAVKDLGVMKNTNTMEEWHEALSKTSHIAAN